MVWQVQEGKSLVGTYESLLKQYSNNRSLSDGKRLHVHMAEQGLDRDTYLGNLLIQMYGKCGSLDDAREAFDRIQNRNVYSWTILASVYVQNEEPREAKRLLKLMDQDGVQANTVTFVTILSACSSTKDLREGKSVHARLSASGSDTDVISGNALLTMYSACGSLEGACSAFEKIACKDTVSWTVMISAYVQFGLAKEAVHLYRRMEQEFARPDGVTFISVVDACASLKDCTLGRWIHERILSTGVETNVYVGTALVTFFGKLGMVEEAEEVFEKVGRKDDVCWNAVIAAFAQNTLVSKAFSLYEKMVASGTHPNDVTFITLLDCCASTCEVDRGRTVHKDIASWGYLSYVSVLNALLNMYAKCGRFEDASQVFERANTSNAITWNTMIVANAQNGFEHRALATYRRMNLEGVEPSDVTYGTVLSACATLGDLATGREVHRRSIATGWCSDVVKNSLICLYGGCGKLDAARDSFNSVSSKSVVSWSSVIAAYARNGEEEVARELFWRMAQEGVEPNNVTLTSVLQACSHVGLAEGRNYFVAMQEDYRMEPTCEHFGCMVNLLGKSGRVEQAVSLLLSMPFEPDTSTWRSLLGACEVHTNRKQGTLAARELFDVDPSNSAAYVLLYNMGTS